MVEESKDLFGLWWFKLNWENCLLEVKLYLFQKLRFYYNSDLKFKKRMEMMRKKQWNTSDWNLDNAKHPLNLFNGKKICKTFHSNFIFKIKIYSFSEYVLEHTFYFRKCKSLQNPIDKNLILNQIALKPLIWKLSLSNYFNQIIRFDQMKKEDLIILKTNLNLINE